MHWKVEYTNKNTNNFKKNYLNKKVSQRIVRRDIEHHDVVICVKVLVLVFWGKFAKVEKNIKNHTQANIQSRV